MGKTRKTYPREFKISAVNQVIGGGQFSQVARENGIHPTLLTHWKWEYTQNPEKVFNGNGNAYKDQAQLAECQRLIGKLYAENEFIKPEKAILRYRCPNDMIHLNFKMDAIHWYLKSSPYSSFAPDFMSPWD